MDETLLNLSFKGDRTYIQGGDIFDAINRIIGMKSPSGWVSHLAFRNFARRDCIVRWSEPSSESRLIAQGAARFPTAEEKFWVIESDKEAVGRRPFDEDKLLAPAVSRQDSIELHGRSEHTPIEEVIALTKRLNYELTSDVDGKWVFGQLDLDDRLPDDYTTLRIVRKNVIGNRFSVNAIDVNGAHIGDIRFIVGSP